MGLGLTVGYSAVGLGLTVRWGGQPLLWRASSFVFVVLTRMLRRVLPGSNSCINHYHIWT